MTKSETTKRVVPAAVLAAAMGGVVLGGAVVTPVLADETGGLTFRQALGAKPSSIFQFAKPSIIVENPAGKVDGTTSAEPVKAEAAAVAASPSAAAPAGALAEKAEKAEKTTDRTGKRGSVRIIPRGTMDPGEPQSLPVPRRSGAVMAEPLPGPDGELPKMASASQAMSVAAKPVAARDTGKGAAASGVARSDVAAKPAAKQVSKQEAATVEPKPGEGKAGSAPDEVGSSDAPAGNGVGESERRQAAADAAGAAASPPQDEAGEGVKVGEAQVAQGDSNHLGQGTAGVKGAAAASMPTGAGGRDAEADADDASGGAVGSVAETDLGGTAKALGKNPGTVVPVSSRDGAEGNGADAGRTPVGDETMKRDEAGMSGWVMFVGGMACSGILIAGLAGLVHWRRRRAVGHSSVVGERMDVSADKDREGRAGMRRGERTATPMVPSATPGRGGEPAGMGGARNGDVATAAVPGEAMPPARVAADLVASDRTSGQVGAGGGLVAVDANRRAVARTDLVAPWHDAEHLAAIVAWAPRDVMRAA